MEIELTQTNPDTRQSLAPKVLDNIHSPGSKIQSGFSKQ